MPAESQAQRKFIFSRFGPQWAAQHHFNNPGPLPARVGMNEGGQVRPEDQDQEEMGRQFGVLSPQELDQLYRAQQRINEQARATTMNDQPREGYNKGGGVMIKPSHRGLFTAKANHAGMGVQEYARKVLGAPQGEYPASTRKQANFARNFGGHRQAMNGGGMTEGPGAWNNWRTSASPPTNVNPQFYAGGPNYNPNNTGNIQVNDPGIEPTPIPHQPGDIRQDYDVQDPTGYNGVFASYGTRPPFGTPGWAQGPTMNPSFFDPQGYPIAQLAFPPDDSYGPSSTQASVKHMGQHVETANRGAVIPRMKYNQGADSYSGSGVVPYPKHPLLGYGKDITPATVSGQQTALTPGEMVIPRPGDTSQRRRNILLAIAARMGKG